MSAHQFELVGGDLVLDFLNTVHDWTAAEPRDYLTSFAEVLRFGASAGALTRGDVQRLSVTPPGSELRRLRDLRTRLERIFRALVSSRTPRPIDLETLAVDAADAARAVRLRGSRGQLTRVIPVESSGPAVLRRRIADAALSLLTSPRAATVKACPACGWFFVDTSKNRSRRWCSMATCGSNAKSNRYYWRRKEARDRRPRRKPNERG